MLISTSPSNHVGVEGEAAIILFESSKRLRSCIVGELLVLQKVELRGDHEENERTQRLLPHDS